MKQWPWPVLPPCGTTDQCKIKLVRMCSLSLRRHAQLLMRTAHLSGNTSGVSKSSSDWLNYTGFPGDVCVAFFNVPPGNKNAVAPNPLTKEESRRVYQDQLNTGFSKVCEIFKVVA